MCRICLECEEKNKIPKPHLCPRNYSGSSKAMEADAALEAILFLTEASHGTAVVGYIVADDDSFMKSYLKHKIPVHPKGCLPKELPEPDFFADPTHRTKVIAKPFFALTSQGKSKTECTSVDAARIKRRWGHIIKMYRLSPFKRMKQAVKSVLEHLFDDHKYCGVKWCIVLREQQQNKTNISPSFDPVGPGKRFYLPPSPKRSPPPARSSNTPKINISTSNPAGPEEHSSRPPSPKCSSPPAKSPNTPESYTMKHPEGNKEKLKKRRKGYYRLNEKHSKLYNEMKTISRQLTTDDKIRECMHPYDSQINEAMDVSVAKYARKDRTYCTTMSLTNRVMIAMGVNNLGYYRYWNRVFESLKIDMSPALKHHLQQKDKTEEKKRKYDAQPKRKKKRARHQYEKMQNELKKQIEDKKKR